MFASEKVMKDYLDQLLTEEPDTLIEEELPEATVPQSLTINSDAIARAESQYSAKIKQKFAQAEDDSNSKRLKLKPIEKAIVADKTLPVKEPEQELSSLEQLLQAVSLQQHEAAEALALEESLEVAVEPEVKASIQVETETKTQTPSIAEELTAKVSIDKIEEPFQALFFNVAGLTLAVPLKELGGIHNLEDVTSLFGKPDWFMGVMVNRDKKINVVESAKWVMPEKYDEALKSQLNYKYLIMLGESNWGLAAETLVTTEYVTPEDVKWRSKAGKRPWLLGTIKEKMCALLHVDDLVAMLEKGVNARQE